MKTKLSQTPSLLKKILVLSCISCISFLTFSQTTYVPVSITQPPALSGSITSQTNILCNGDNTGSVTVAGAGGTVGYQYSLDGGAYQGSGTFSGLTAGSYIVTVQDANLCTVNVPVTITEPAPLVATASSNSPVCAGDMLSLTGGPAAMVGYNWSGPLAYASATQSPTVSATATAGMAGVYTITVTNAAGCTSTASTTVTVNAVPWATASNNGPVCVGNPLTLTGGPGAGTSYSWSGPLAYASATQSPTVSATATAGMVGVYTITVTNAAGCTDTETTAVIVNDLPTPTATSNSPVCVGDALTLSGSPGGMTAYSWSGPLAYANGTQSPTVSASATASMAGVYTITVTNAAGCTATTTTTVVVNSAPTADAGIDQTICDGSTATLTASGGTTYVWSEGSTDATITVSPASTTIYTVTVSNGGGCTATDSVLVTVGVTPTVNAGNDESTCFASSYSITGASALDNNSVQWTSSGTGSFNNASVLLTTYSISAGDLAAGSIYLTLTATNDCGSVSDSMLLAISSGPDISLSGTDVSGAGNNGAIDLTVNSGFSPFVYSWANGQTTQDLSNLTPGTYIVTVYDMYSCSTIDSIAIGTQGNALIAAISSNSNVLCYGNCTGTATVAGFGGTPPYNYQWNDLAAHTSQTATGLCAGTYNVTVTDQTSSSAVASITITSPIIMEISYIKADASEIGVADGAINITVTGGKTPYSYLWSSSQTTQDLTGLLAGTYQITVTDANNCTKTKTVIVKNACTMTLTSTITNATCGQHNGSATVSVSGGTSPYAYSWSTGAVTANADSLEAGSHLVTVTGADQCVSTLQAVVNSSGGATITVNSITNILCPGINNGVVDMSVSGGNPPYTYEWTSGAVSEDLINVPAGSYELIVTGSTGCITSQSVIIAGTEGFEPTISTQMSSCGNANGIASVEITGGTPPYTFNWSTGGDSSTISNLVSGVYSVTVHDANGCTVLYGESVSVSDSAGAVISVDSIIPVSCGNADGAVYISVTGSIPPYSYEWSSSAATEDITTLSAGNYVLTVTDSLGCKATISAFVQEFEPLTQPICMVSVDSSTGNNWIIWEKIQTTSVQQYNIYREVYTEVFFKIAEVPYDDMSEYIDPDANPNTRAWKYAISSVDNCGNESEIGPPHKTLHLTVNPGLSQTVNLIWDAYQGLDYMAFYLHRHTNATGWEIIDSLPTTYWTYTDTPPNWGQLSYRISVKKEFPCYPSSPDKAQSGPYSQSFSNLDDNGVIEDICATNPVTTGQISGSNLVQPGETVAYFVLPTANSTYQWLITGGMLLSGQNGNTIIVVWDSTGTGEVSVTETNSAGCTGSPIIRSITIDTGIGEIDFENSVNIFPNPNEGTFTIVISGNLRTNTDIEIVNVNGQVVYMLTTGKHEKMLKISLDHEPKGVYFVKVKNDDFSKVEKVVVR